MNFQNYFTKHKEILLYGIALAFFLIILNVLELRFLIYNNSIEFYIGAIAIIFTGLGIWLALKLIKPKVDTVFVEKEVIIHTSKEFVFNQTEANRIGISKREMEVLDLMARGLSNEEIASQLFLSLNTVKTHCSNLFDKMEVRRRTQAIEKAKRLNLIP